MSTVQEKRNHEAIRTIQIPKELHKQVAQVALDRDEYIQDIVVKAILAGLSEVAKTTSER